MKNELQGANRSVDSNFSHIFGQRQSRLISEDFPHSRCLLCVGFALGSLLNAYEMPFQMCSRVNVFFLPVCCQANVMKQQNSPFAIVMLSSQAQAR